MRARLPLCVGALMILTGSGAAFAEEINVWSSTSVEYSTGMREPVVRHESSAWTNGEQIQIQGENFLQAQTQQQTGPENDQPQRQQRAAVYPEATRAHQNSMPQAEQQMPYQWQQPFDFDFDTFFHQTFSMFGSDMNSWPTSWVWDPVWHEAARAPQRSVYVNGLQETPPVDTRGYGIARIWFQEGDLHYSIETYDLTSPIVGAHFHRAPVGVKGPVVQPITFQGNHAEGVWHLSEQDAQDLLSGRIYLNVHTEAYPDGEIRGQL